MAGILKVDRVQSDSNLAFQVASANVAYINSTGLNITGGQIIGNGNIYRESNGLLYANNGIAFPATQVTSADPNTLDDYEEGTWSPTIGGSTTNPTATYTANNGTYTKIGRLVTVNIFINLSAVSGGSGYAIIRGFPFTNTGNENAGNIGYNSIYTSTTTPSTIHIASGSNVAYTYIKASADARDTMVTANDVSHFRAGYLYASITYSSTS